MIDLDYPVAAPNGVDPVIFRAQILQLMAHRHKGAYPALTDAESFAAAMATWETDWSDDPTPRTIEAAYDEVDADLSYWGEE